MVIPKTSIIEIMSGVPLDNTYEHTVYFETENEQRSTFAGFKKFTLNNQSFQRVSSNSMKIALPIEELYECNYLAFQNPRIGGGSSTIRWFYAFITNVEYINNETSLVEYEIDVIQTYLLKLSIYPCFIERQHSETDVPGDNIVSENLDIGEYYSKPRIGSGLFDNYNIVMCSPYEFFGSELKKTYDFQNVCGIPEALHYYYYSNSEGSSALSKFTADLAAFDEKGYSNEILCVYLIPSGFTEQLIARGKLPNKTVTNTITYVSKPTKLGDYTPRNKKLLTAPFNIFTINTFSGDEHSYAYEFFDDALIQFKVYANLNANTSFKCVPINYKGREHAFDEGIVLSEFPLLAYSSDVYKEWLARNKARLGLQGINALIGGYNGFGTVIKGMNMKTPKTNVISSKGAKNIGKGSIEMLESGVGGIADIISQGIGARTLGSTPMGTADGSLEFGMGVKDFNMIRKYITPEYAKIIDDYFDMFGYALHEVKTPKLKVRKHWTYIKTMNFQGEGTFNSNDLKNIANIFNKGITFWVNISEVGNYGLAYDNTPIEEGGN